MNESWSIYTPLPPRGVACTKRYQQLLTLRLLEIWLSQLWEAFSHLSFWFQVHHSSYLIFISYLYFIFYLKPSLVYQNVFFSCLKLLQLFWWQVKWLKAKHVEKCILNLVANLKFVKRNSRRHMDLEPMDNAPLAFVYAVVIVLIEWNLPRPKKKLSGICLCLEPHMHSQKEKNKDLNNPHYICL